MTFKQMQLIRHGWSVPRMDFKASGIFLRPFIKNIFLCNTSAYSDKTIKFKQYDREFINRNRYHYFGLNCMAYLGCGIRPSQDVMTT